MTLRSKLYSPCLWFSLVHSNDLSCYPLFLVTPPATQPAAPQSLTDGSEPSVAVPGLALLITGAPFPLKLNNPFTFPPLPSPPSLPRPPFSPLSLHPHRPDVFLPCLLLMTDRLFCSFVSGKMKQTDRQTDKQGETQTEMKARYFVICVL